MIDDAHDAPVAEAVLIRKRWLSRSLRVRVFRTEYRVVYSGVCGCRLQVYSERTLQAGIWVAEHRFLGDFAAPLPGPWPPGVTAPHYLRLHHLPRIDFALSAVPARLEVRLWPWWAIRGLRLRLADVVLYAEGCYATPDAPMALPTLWDSELDGGVRRGDGA